MAEAWAGAALAWLVRPRAVRDYADRIGHPLRAEPFGDQTNRPDGWPGKYNASHAEKQQALTSPGHPVGVTRPMCPDCQGFFQKHAIASAKEQLVTDPEVSRLFLPDGRVIEMLPGDFPRLVAPGELDGRTAVGVGATSEGLSATQRDAPQGAGAR